MGRPVRHARRTGPARHPARGALRRPDLRLGSGHRRRHERRRRLPGTAGPAPAERRARRARRPDHPLQPRRPRRRRPAGPRPARSSAPPPVRPARPLTPAGRQAGEPQSTCSTSPRSPTATSTSSPAARRNVVTSGTPADVYAADLIETVYGLPVDVDLRDGTPEVRAALPIPGGRR
ncbi:hypothetical protein FRAHR75_510022 [Frankia sp. Hr75.2]|nr:hypothetical protein FRAHR75_510022 [Frankia sp. Hr75.2]